MQEQSSISVYQHGMCIMKLFSICSIKVSRLVSSEMNSDTYFYSASHSWTDNLGLELVINKVKKAKKKKKY